PHVLNRVELGTFGWQRDDGDVGRYDQACRHVPAGLVDQEDSVGGGCNGRGDLRKVQVHRFGIAGRQDQGCALAPLRTYRTEDIGGGGPLVTRCAWAVPRFAQRRVVLFFWPMRASSANQISIVSQSSALAHAISSRRTGKLF